eukprot:746700-Hanusia_phi.AAC.4
MPDKHTSFEDNNKNAGDGRAKAEGHSRVEEVFRRFEWLRKQRRADLPQASDEVIRKNRGNMELTGRCCGTGMENPPRGLRESCAGGGERAEAAAWRCLADGRELPAAMGGEGAREGGTREEGWGEERKQGERAERTRGRGQRVGERWRRGGVLSG